MGLKRTDAFRKAAGRVVLTSGLPSTMVFGPMAENRFTYAKDFDRLAQLAVLAFKGLHSLGHFTENAQRFRGLLEYTCLSSCS